MPALIVNADDLGRTAGVNRGILEAHKKGIVTSTSALVNYPDAAQGIAMMQAEAPFLGVGLHLNLTSGRPVSAPEDIPSLVGPDGLFRRPEGWGAVMVAFDPADVERELRAQFDRFVALAGKLPTHLDTHHHAVYMVPAGLRTMLALAAEHGLPIRRPPLEDLVPEKAADLWLLEGLAPAEARAVVEEVLSILESHPDVRYPDHFATSFYDQHAILGELLAILTTLPASGVTELMCHPGYAEGLDSAYSAQREIEIKWLTFPATHEVIVAEDIHLINFGDLGQNAG